MTIENKEERKNIPDLEIRDLIVECQNGDIKSFEKLYNLHKTKMFNIAYRIHGNGDDAADSLQDAFIKVYKNIKNFRLESSFSSWFYRILVNTCLDNIEKNKINKKNNLENIDKYLSFTPSSEVISKIIEHEIGKLTTAYRTVFVLYEIEGFSHQEIAGILGVSIGTSKSNLHRAKEILKIKLKPYYDEFKDK